jgi:LysM repeat protein
MESRIGKDFHHVRVHTDIGAVDTSRQLRARAFTVGQNIYFNEGQYRPDSFEGRKLLAHELAHVMQQQEVLSAKIQRECTPGTATCVGSINQPVHSPHAHNETCSKTSNPNPRIQRIEVYRNDFRLRVFFRDGTTTRNPWNCSPSLSSGPDGKEPTPLGHDQVGKKCDNCHTNRSGDGMGFFTGFASRDLAIGFHNSQRVGSGIESHGCVRVSCSHARTINRDTSSSTVIEVLQNEPPDSGISGGMRVYTIRAGDTLGGIARRFDTTVARLRELNNIAEGAESSIQPGQTLVIPGSSSSSSSSGTPSYTVESGDTLSEIAERFGTTVARLRELNNIAEGAESSIQPGQILVVREPPR